MVAAAIGPVHVQTGKQLWESILGGPISVSTTGQRKT